MSGARFATLDPRAQLWLLAVVVAGVLAGGDPGLVGGATAAAVGVARAGQSRAYARLVLALLPLGVALLVLNALAGRPADGARLAARVLALSSVGFAFARVADGEAMVAGLRALGLPYAATFVLVAGARFVPTTADDLADLRDAARLRGLGVGGPPWRQLAGWRVLLVPLLVGSVRRGLQLGEAMEARGFGAAARRTTRRRLAWRPRDSLGVLAGAAYVVLVWHPWT